MGAAMLQIASEGSLYIQVQLLCKMVQGDISV